MGRFQEVVARFSVDIFCPKISFFAKKQTMPPRAANKKTLPNAKMQRQTRASASKSKSAVAKKSPKKKTAEKKGDGTYRYNVRMSLFTWSGIKRGALTKEHILEFLQDESQFNPLVEYSICKEKHDPEEVAERAAAPHLLRGGGDDLALRDAAGRRGARAPVARPRAGPRGARDRELHDRDPAR